MIYKVPYRLFGRAASCLMLVSCCVMPVVSGWPPLFYDSPERARQSVIGLSIGLVFLFSISLARRIYTDYRLQGFSSLWLPLFGLVSWFVTVLRLYWLPDRQSGLEVMTLPLFLVGMALVIYSLGWAQEIRSAWSLSKRMQDTTDLLVKIIAGVSLYGGVVFTTMYDTAIGMAVFASGLLLVDPRWPAIWAASKRRKYIRSLQEGGVQVYREEALDDLHAVKQVVTGKDGILTSRQETIEQITAVAKGYTRENVLAIMAGLETAMIGSLAEAIRDYAAHEGVTPSRVSNTLPMYSIGVQGMVGDKHFKFVSLSYAQEHYTHLPTDLTESLLASGYSASVLLDRDQQIVGVLEFSRPLARGLLDVDELLQGRDLPVQLATSDTEGSTKHVTEMMPTIDQVTSGVSYQAKVERERDWVAMYPSLLLTDQPVPAKTKPEVLITVARELKRSDLVVGKIADLPQVWEAADEMRQVDNSTLLWWEVIVMAVVIGLAVGAIFFQALHLLVPIVVVLARSVVTFTLYLLLYHRKS